MGPLASGGRERSGMGTLAPRCHATWCSPSILHVRDHACRGLMLALVGRTSTPPAPHRRQRQRRRHLLVRTRARPLYTLAPAPCCHTELRWDTSTSGRATPSLHVWPLCSELTPCRRLLPRGPSRPRQRDWLIISARPVSAPGRLLAAIEAAALTAPPDISSLRACYLW